ncbi:hypothetical protein [Vibrio splendidus]|uniref:hypothetical protein n=1 Tax=Vibrio splendidus TaxID=29497 RepID=UPI000C844B17|nr:hypothetical protein [Vibrio splendidus]PMI72788.1 hypothetical protein BCU38_02190 [Vibrio splendidus]
MKKLRVPYDIIGVREASLDSLQEELQPFNFTSEYEKLKKTALSLSTFSIFMVSFNLTTPLTIATGVASISIGNLTLFFVLLLIYQLYTLKCLRDEFALIAENTTGSLKQKYYFYLLCRRAALNFKERNLVRNTSDIEFSMHGFEVDKRMVHAPTIVQKFTNDTQLEQWRSKLPLDFAFRKYVNPNEWQIYLKDSTISQEDLDFWHKNKKRIYVKRKPIHNHYYIPLAYSALGILTTLLMIFPEFREWLISVPNWISSLIVSMKSTQ